MANLTQPDSNRELFSNEEWMTTADAMAYFKVSRRTLQRWCQDKEIYSVYIGGTKYYPKKFIERLMLTKINWPWPNDSETGPNGSTAPA